MINFLSALSIITYAIFGLLPSEVVPHVNACVTATDDVSLLPSDMRILRFDDDVIELLAMDQTVQFSSPSDGIKNGVVVDDGRGFISWHVNGDDAIFRYSELQPANLTQVAEMVGFNHDSTGYSMTSLLDSGIMVALTGYRYAHLDVRMGEIVREIVYPDDIVGRTRLYHSYSGDMLAYQSDDGFVIKSVIDNQVLHRLDRDYYPSNIAWSREDHYLSFVQDGYGLEPPKVYIYYLATGELQEIMIPDLKHLSFNDGSYDEAMIAMYLALEGRKELLTIYSLGTQSFLPFCYEGQGRIERSIKTGNHVFAWNWTHDNNYLWWFERGIDDESDRYYLMVADIWGGHVVRVLSIDVDDFDTIYRAKVVYAGQ